MRLKNPNMYSGAYLLHLYCDQEGCYGDGRGSGFLEVGEFSTKSMSLRAARATCPRCLVRILSLRPQIGNASAGGTLDQPMVVMEKRS